MNITRPFLSSIYIIFSLFVYSSSAVAQQEDLCKSEFFECVEVNPSPPFFRICAGCFAPEFDSVGELLEFYSPTVGGCMLKAESSASFSGYAEPGVGRQRDADGQTLISWNYSINRFERIVDAIRVSPDGVAPGADPSSCDNFEVSFNDLVRERFIECPSRTTLGFCGEYNVAKTPKDPPCSNTTNNPCQVSTGAKVRHESDITDESLDLVRNYHSSNIANSGFGRGWHTKYFRRMIQVFANRRFVVSLIEEGGNRVTWSASGVGDPDNQYKSFRSIPFGGGFQLVSTDETVSNFNSDGFLTNERYANGRLLNYAYDTDNRLIRVSDEYGKELRFSYGLGSNLISSVTDAVGSVTKYTYDENDNLVTVTYPDLTADDNDNPTKTYHYENSDYPHHLTGITDENGTRYATFTYDANGKAKTSELGLTSNSVGQEKVQLDYQGEN